MPYKDPEKEREARRKRQRRQRKNKLAAGLCTKCAEPSLQESVLCEKHLKKEQERDNDRRKWHINQGYCQKCLNPPEPRHRYCKKHLQNDRIYNKNSKKCLDCNKWAKQGHGRRCASCAKKVNQRTKKYQAIHKQQGLCRSCPNPAVKNSLCEKCYKRERVYKKVFIENAKVQGLCDHCGSNPCAEGRTKCESCLEQQRQYKYKHGSLPKEKIKQMRYQRSIQFMKQESPMLKEHWDDVKDWINEHADIFYDKVDPVLFNTAMTLEEYEGEIDKDKDTW